MLKYCDTVDSIFDYIEISFTDQNGRPLQIDNDITVSIIIKKSKELKKASKRIKNAASKFNQSKYGKISKTQGSEFGKIAGKKIVQQSAEAAGDLIGSKIADKITSLKVKEKPKEVIEEEQEIIIPPEKRQQIINDLRLF